MPARLHLTSGGSTWTAEVSGNRVSIDPGARDLAISRDGDRLIVQGAGGAHAGVAASLGDVVWVSIDAEVFSFTVTQGASRARAGSTRDHDAFTPPMSATVVRINVAAGDRVKDGDVLVALEAMKMELPIRAPRDGIVRAVHCQVGELVQPGEALLELED